MNQEMAEGLLKTLKDARDERHQMHLANIVESLTKITSNESVFKVCVLIMCSGLASSDKYKDEDLAGFDSYAEEAAADIAASIKKARRLWIEHKAEVAAMKEKTDAKSQRVDN